MKQSKTYSICIIGGGAAGVMAALRSVLNNDDTIFFPGTRNDKRKSRAFWVSKVENVPGLLNYSKGIEQPNKETLNWLMESDFSNKFDYKKNRGIVSISKNDSGIFEINDDEGNLYHSEFVILCTGVMDVQPKINGSISQILPYANVQLADYCLRCDGHHVLNQRTTVLFDGGDGGAWVSIMLMERYNCPEMTLLSNGANINISDDVMKLLVKYNVKFNSKKIIDIVGDAKKHQLEKFIMEDGESVKSDISFISLGMIVYNDLALKVGAKVDKRGFVTTNLSGESSVSNFYIAGDLRAGIKKQIYSSWDSAVDSADHINGILRRKKRDL